MQTEIEKQQPLLKQPALPQAFGKPMDDFLLPLLDGGEASLSGRLEGKRGGVVVFWSAICSHCVRYDAYFSTFEQRHPELCLIVVASRIGETGEQIQQAAGERGIRFPIALDSAGATARKWSTQQTPRAFLVDSRRTLLYRGAVDNFKYPADPEYAPYLEPAISQFLSGEPIHRVETASFGCAIQSVYYNLPRSL